MFGRATIRLGIGPHSSLGLICDARSQFGANSRSSVGYGLKMTVKSICGNVSETVQDRPRLIES